MKGARPPQPWKPVRLGDILRRHNEINHPGDHASGQAIFVGLEHIEAHTGRRLGSSTIDLANMSGRKPTFRRGQIVYGYLRPYLNKVWIADLDGCSSVDQFAFDVDEKLACTPFVAAFMRSGTFLRRAQVATTTGQLPRISIDEILAVEIELPPAMEQELIAGRLTEQLAAVAHARAAAQCRLDAACALPAAYLSEVFEGEEAQEWQTVAMGAVCRVVEGQVDPRDPVYGALPHINGQNIESGTGRLLEVNSASDDGLISGKYLFERGMVLYSKLRPYLRKATMAPFRGVCSADMYPLIFDPERVDSTFAMWSLLAAPFTRYAVKASERARMPKLNREQLLGWDMPLPPDLAAQRRIAADLASRLGEAERLVKLIRDEVAVLEAVPAALMREAFQQAI